MMAVFEVTDISRALRLSESMTWRTCSSVGADMMDILQSAFFSFAISLILRKSRG